MRRNNPMVLILALVLAGCPPAERAVPPAAPAPPATPPAAPSKTLWADAFAVLEKALTDAVLLGDKDRLAAAKAVDEAYRTLYEGEARNIEVATRLNVGKRQVAEREDAFARLKQSLKLGAPAAATNKILVELLDGVRADVRALDELEVAPPK